MCRIAQEILTSRAPRCFGVQDIIHSRDLLIYIRYQTVSNFLGCVLAAFGYNMAFPFGLSSFSQR